MTWILFLEGHLASSLNPTFTDMDMKIPRLWEYFPKRRKSSYYLHVSGWLMNKLKPKHRLRRTYQSLSSQMHGTAPATYFFQSKRNQKMKKTFEMSSLRPDFFILKFFFFPFTSKLIWKFIHHTPSQIIMLWERKAVIIHHQKNGWSPSSKLCLTTEKYYMFEISW